MPAYLLLRPHPRQPAAAHLAAAVLRCVPAAAHLLLLLLCCVLQDDRDEPTVELCVFAECFQEMLMWDYGNTIYRALLQERWGGGE